MSKRKAQDEGDDAGAATVPKTDKKRQRADAEGESRKKKKAKKDVKKQEEEQETHEDAETVEPAQDDKPTSESAPAKKDKKKKKTKANPDSTSTTTTAKPTTTEEASGEASAEAEADAKKRFIVFVGNLPYSATQAQISAHFTTVHPTAVRLLHEKHDPRRSRGIAFVEFARYDHMKTALKLFHHSTFKCASAANGREEERKINVELTAGGGGNTDLRRERIRAKNEKLNEERARRAKEEARVRDKKGREKKGGGDNNEEDEGEEEDGKKKRADAVHPSRQRRVRGSWN